MRIHKRWIVLLALALCLTLACGIAFATYSRTLKRGCKGDDVLELQQSLNQLAFSSLTLNGSYGSATVKAVKAFQKAQKLTVDGIAGTKTLNRLTTRLRESASYPRPERTLKKGSSGTDVKSVQWRLKLLGYYTGSVDGKYGTNTVKAVKNFQKAKGLKADGICGTKTYDKLYPVTTVTEDATPTATQMPDATATPVPTKTSAPTQTPEPTATPKPTATPVPTNYPTLKKGSTGEAVANLQAALAFLDYTTNTYGFYTSYDSKTVTAVKQFQTNNGLKADGIAGPATQALLYSGSAKRGSASAGIGEDVGKMSGPSLSKIKLLWWYADVKPILKNGQTLLVWDPATGLAWNYRVMSNGRHCDVEPKTAQDTAIMYRAFGNQNDWGPKVVYVKLPNGTWTIGATHNVAHGGQTITDNQFNGQNCLHFLRTLSETRQYDPNYGVQNQEAIRSYWKLLTGATISD